MELPVCDHRELNAHESGKHICNHPWTHGGKEMGVEDSFCLKCAFSKTKGTLQPQAPIIPHNPGRGDCQHLGGITRKVDCPTCNPAKKIQVAVHSCAVFGECTINKPVPGLACCAGRCGKYQPREKWAYDGPVKRHLLYHVYPLNGQKNRGIWQANVRQLFDSARFEQFSTAHVAVAVDGNTDSADAVRQAFSSATIPVEVKEFPNNPGLREVVSHNWLWSQVPKGKNDLTFWGHAKGVTHSVAHKTVHQWARMMYDAMLDYPGIVEEQLRGLACTGAFKKLGAGWNARESRSQWHYTGSFVWVRNCRLPDGWAIIDRFKDGVEPWPSLHFHESEAGFLVKSASIPEMNFYNVQVFRTNIVPAYQQWIDTNKSRKQCAKT